MNNRQKKAWEDWRVLHRAYARQVSRAAQGIANTDENASECALAIVAIASMLEAYSNFRSELEFDRPIVECLKKVPVPQRYLLYPRVAGAPHSYIVQWEGDSIHKEVKGIFTQRNNIAHANKTLSFKDCTPAKVAQLWDTCLDLLLRLETGPAGRIPASRHLDFEEEIDALRVKART